MKHELETFKNELKKKSLLEVKDMLVSHNKISQNTLLMSRLPRGGLVVVEGEHQRQRGEGLLPARQVADVLPALLGRPDGEDDALGERVQGVDQLQLGVPAQGDHLVHLLQLPRDDLEPVHEVVEPLLLAVVVVLLLEVHVLGDQVELAHALQVDLLLPVVLLDGRHVWLGGGDLRLDRVDLQAELLEV